jgi:branched-chain amino acid transport system ATP-binding protein
MAPPSASVSAEPMLEVESLVKRFGGLVAVDGVSLAVPPGEILGVVGPNGSGKTTLFSLVSGFLVPDAGRVRLEGTDITGERPERIALRGLVRTFQIVQPFAELSVIDNVIVGALKGGARSLAEARVTAEAVLTRVAFRASSKVLAAALTIADRKRLELARALAAEPRILLLDEVMAGLRPAEVDQAVALIAAIRASGVTIVMVEHLIRAVVAISDRVIVLHQGRVIAEGAPREALADAAVVRAYFGGGNA